MIARFIRSERMGIHMAGLKHTILSDVQDEATVDQSIIVLLDGINAQLKAAGTDPAKIAAVRSAIAANKAAIVAAVLRNTSVVAATGPTVIPASVSVSNGSSVQLSVDDASGTDITASASY